MNDLLLQYKEILVYLAIPVTSALVGWLTNIVAIKDVLSN